ncbi:MAG: hypothetical protein JO318_02140, partial [Chloroflexi bacterium]|nr:hypothetical protein [Chloroflexota bacterium]
MRIGGEPLGGAFAHGREHGKQIRFARVFREEDLQELLELEDRTGAWRWHPFGQGAT